MSMQETSQVERELTLDDIIDETIFHFDLGLEVLTYEEPDGANCEMTPEEFELARASITYLGYRLLMMYRMERDNPPRNAGWVDMRRISASIYKEIASSFAIPGNMNKCVDEVKRLYSVAEDKLKNDEEYRRKIEYIMGCFMEDYDFGTEDVGIAFV